MTRRYGWVEKVASKERMGREPLRQLPGKWSSDIVWTFDRHKRISFLVKSRHTRKGRICTVLKMHFDGRTIGRFAHPYVKIFSLARFEKEDVVAVVEFGKFIELIEFGFCIKFGIFPAVG